MLDKEANCQPVMLTEIFMVLAVTGTVMLAVPLLMMAEDCVTYIAFLNTMLGLPNEPLVVEPVPITHE